MDSKRIIERIKRASAGEWINALCCVVSVSLAIWGFIVPPTGEVHTSVLIVIGELGFFSTINKIPDFIKALKGGASLEINKGDAHIKIEGEDSKE